MSARRIVASPRGMAFASSGVRAFPFTSRSHGSPRGIVRHPALSAPKTGPRPRQDRVRMSEKPVTSKTSITISLTFTTRMPPLLLMVLWAESSTRSPAEEM